MFAEELGHGVVACGAIGVVGEREDGSGYAGGACARKCGRVRPVGADGRDLDALAPVHVVEDRLQVGPGARGQHADPHATSSLG